MRKRSETLGPLGRAPARSAKLPLSAAGLPPSGTPVAPGGAVRAWLRGAFLDNLPLKFLSIVLAVTVFLLVNTDEQREISVRVGVAYDYPADQYVLTSKPIEEARVTIRGPWRRLRHFDERELSRILLDLRQAPTGEIALTPNLIENVPSRLTVIAVSPRSVHVAFDHLATKTVPVAPRTDGKVEAGHFIGSVVITPDTVRIRGGEHALAAVVGLKTFDIPLAGHTESFDATPAIDAPDGVTVDAGKPLTVHVRIDELPTKRVFDDVPVAIDAEPGVDATLWEVSPARLAVTLTGGPTAIEQAVAGMRAHVALHLDDVKAREGVVMIDGLPDTVTAHVTPARVKLVPIVR